MGRKARKDFAFSDGTVISAGVQVAVVSWCEHLDEVTASFIAISTSYQVPAEKL